MNDYKCQFDFKDLECLKDEGKQSMSSEVCDRELKRGFEIKNIRIVRSEKENEKVGERLLKNKK